MIITLSCNFMKHFFSGLRNAVKILFSQVLFSYTKIITKILVLQYF